jgi:integrase
MERGLVFTTPKGTPLVPSNLDGRLRPLLEDARRLPMGGSDYCASLLLSQGISALVVMDQLGHSQISLTMETYSHVMPVMLRDSAAALESALNATETG